MKKITILDLFSGIGGFHLGFENVGYDVKTFFSEVDAHAIAVYKYNFKNSKYVGSVTDVRGKQLPKINVITFGSPCQDFSVAGNRKGMGGDRSSLILEAIRLINECRPGVFIWENVKGTFSSNDGRDLAAILQAFANIGGYRLEWQLCNTSWFLPQNRERIYLVGYSANPSRDWKGVFPIEISPSKTQGIQKGVAQVSNFSEREFGFKDTAPALLSRDYKDPKIVRAADYRNDEGLRIRTEGDSPCLSARRHSEKDISTMPPLVLSGALRTRAQGKDLETRKDNVSNAVTTHPLDSIIVPTQLGNSIKTEGEDAFTLRSSEPNGVIENESIRRLTPIECERLQGFPDNWTQYGIYDGKTKKVSNTQRYKMCGNAVTVNVVEVIVNQCKDIL
tara:strand:+ start:1320 stop:2492 length:1173 start_codon:yes stop_codon:yes gene_type:complete